jgi:hypothetical protein
MKETDLYEQIAQYMNLKHPNVIYHFDLSGLWTPSHQARNLYGRLNKRAWPDLFIGVVRETVVGIYVVMQAGLFIELKKDGTVLYKKDGSLRAVPHHIEQEAVLQSLRMAKFKAEFAVGFDQAIKLIDDYLLQ